MAHEPGSGARAEHLEAALSDAAGEPLIITIGLFDEGLKTGYAATALDGHRHAVLALAGSPIGWAISAIADHFKEYRGQSSPDYRAKWPEIFNNG